MRGVNSFVVGQIWAAYDEEKMPLRYARINSINRFPFSLHISWLRPAPRSPDERRWLKVGLPVACGNFELERNEAMTTEVKMFSHIVSCLATSPPDPIDILPKENEIWAIYKDWTPRKWCSDPEERKGCTLQMVEILTSYSGLEDDGCGLGKGRRVQKYFQKTQKQWLRAPFHNLFKKLVQVFS